MKFIELIENCSPDSIEVIKNLIKERKIKLMRHQFDDDISILTKKPNKYSDQEIRDKNLIINVLSKEAKLSAIRSDVKLAEITCAEQENDVLKDTDIVFAFAASTGKFAEFIGAFNITGKSDLDNFKKKYSSYLSDLPEELEEKWKFKQFVTKLGYSKYPRENSHYYNMKLSDHPINLYKNRVVIEWTSPIAWHQYDLGKEITQIRAKGFVRDFTDYYDFVLSFDELKAILNQPEGNPEWISKLSGVSGVYLIVDIKTGSQYIGSAYGARGFLGRWENYAANNHGGNKSLIDLTKSNDNYASNFQISILRVMDKSSSKEQVINAESFLKRKLGTRVHGLNNN